MKKFETERRLVSESGCMSVVSAKPEFLTIEEAAAILRIGRTAAYALGREYLATDGLSGMPVIRFGRLLRVPRAKLEAMLGGPITWPLTTATAASSACCSATSVAGSGPDVAVLRVGRHDPSEHLHR
jgi:hypothetical protein